MTKFKYRKEHQSYPNRVHGGLLTSMLDEMGLRALWAKNGDQGKFGVTISLDTKYRKPVPYDIELIGKGVIIEETKRSCTAFTTIMDKQGNILTSGTIKYLLMDVAKIDENIIDEADFEYMIEDDVTEIIFEK